MLFDFWHTIAQSPLYRNALFMGLLVSIACGVVGTCVVTRRITYMAAGVAHSLLAGMGVALYLRVVHGWALLHPLHGAIVAALLAALLIWWIILRAREREDTAIGTVWAVGMAIGFLFIKMTPGGNQDLTSYLFGSILLVSPHDLWLTAALDGVILALVILFLPQLKAICFDEEFARLRNLRVDLLWLLLLALTALTVVMLVTVVGIVLVIALLTLPAAIAGRLCSSMGQMMWLASLLCALFTVGGLWTSHATDMPAGPTIIVVAGLVYFLPLLVRLGRSPMTPLLKVIHRGQLGSETR